MPSRTRCLLLLALPTVAVLVAVALCMHWLRPRSAINRENAAKIQNGMTVTEVNALLGGPGRQEGGDFTVSYTYTKRTDLIEDCICWTWASEECGVMIDFHDGVVCHSVVGVSTRTDETLPQKVRRWFGL